MPEAIPGPAPGPFAPIAIVGYACILPGANTPDALWRIVATGTDAVTRATAARWGVDPARFLIDAAAAAAGREGAVSDRGGFVSGFDALFDPTGFRLDAAMVATLDPLTQWLLHTGREALGGAGRDERPQAYRRGGAIVGNLGYPTRGLVAAAAAIRNGTPHPRPLDRFSTGLPVQHLAAALDLTDGGFALDAACASSLYALKLACDRLHDGAVDFMLAGAVNAIDNLTLFAGFTALGALSPTGRSRPFHREADGLLPAEGAVLFVLKRLDDAIAAGDPIRAVIRGIGLANDGRGRGFLVPSVAGQVMALRAAYAAAGIAPSAISLLECHATGTQRGDATELESTGIVYAGQRDVPIGSLKSNFGHLVTASGGAGLVKVVEAMRHAVRPPTLWADDPAPAVAQSPFRLLAANEPWACAGPRIAGISSFGFGGNDAHLIVQEWTGAERFAMPVATPPAPPGEHPSVALVALAVRAADGTTTANFREHLLEGQRRGDVSGAPAAAIDLPAEAIRIPPNDLRDTLPQHLFALRVALDAVSEISCLPNERTSVFIGMQCDAEATRALFRWRRPDLGATSCDRESGTGHIGSATVLGAMPNMPANRINALLDLRGPSFTVFAEELSGHHALALARRALACGEIDAAIVGAVDLACEPTHAAAVRALLPETFHRPGDGAVAFVLKRTDDAHRDGDTILATIGERDDAADAWDPVSERTRATFGHVHAAGGLLDVAAAALALRDGFLPPSVAGDATPTVPWTGTSERRVRVARGGIGGETASVVLCADAASTPQPWFASAPPRVRCYGAPTLALLRDTVRAGRTLPPGAGVPAVRLALVATADALHATHVAALAFLAGDPERTPPPPGVSFGIGETPGELAFVFTGASAAYAGMGRDLLLGLPQLARAFRAKHPGIAIDAGWIYADRAVVGDGQRLVATTSLTQIHARLLRDVLGIEPHAALGLSSGETNALFAFDAWTDMAGLFRDIFASGMYNRDLGGEHTVAREYWKTQGIAGDAWATWHAAAPSDRVAAAVAAEPGTNVSIVNTPGSVVFAGEARACERVAARLGAGTCTPIDVQLACHTPAIAAYAPIWHALHARPTTAPAGVRFYANAHNAAYPLTSQSVADALTAQAIASIDFPRTIRQAWDDGVRTFVELGPRDHCRRAIAETLGARPHLAVALDRFGASSLTTTLHAAAALFARGIPLAYDRLEHLVASAEPHEQPPAAFAMPAHPPSVARSTPHRESVATMPPAPVLAVPEPFAPIARALAVSGGERGLRFTREQLLTLASGRISDVLGPVFARQDDFARQVRMPEPPLLLADRITGLVSAPGHIGTGTLWSETDVRPDSWYLHGGRMPVSVTIESGQADLLLISWLGADFRNEGERVYRLLGCELEFLGDLPEVGDTLSYDIHVDGNANLGPIRMFFFHYDCTIAGAVRVRVRNGQAGFFTDGDLADSGGILWSPTDDGAGPDRTHPSAPPRVVPRASHFDAEAIAKFCAGDIFGAFGPGFERAASHTRTPLVPVAARNLFREVTHFDPHGGPWGRGYLRAEQPVTPEDWFFAGHFKNDPCMPGTLMLDAAAQTLAFFMTASGFTLDRDGWRFAPALNEVFSLRCRGQVRPQAKTIVYEVFVHEIEDGPNPIIRADFLATVDGLKAFHGRKIALRLVHDWPLPRRPISLAPSITDEHAIRAAATGKPAEAFGAATASQFPEWRNVQRLPGEPFLCMTRIREITDVRDAKGALGIRTEMTAEFDLTPDRWFFRESASGAMPFAILLEAALQPCGWLCSYVGATIPRDAPMLLRNLDGDATVHARVEPCTGTLVTRARLTSFTRMGNVCLTSFATECRLDGALIFSGTTVFGVFPEEMLVDQAGLVATDAERALLAAPPNTDFPSAVAGRLRMHDRITGFWPDGGAQALGTIRGELAVDPASWMFKAHFFNDPVQPGSLGLEALIQLLQAAMIRTHLTDGMTAPRFDPIAAGQPLVWKYRGQVVPTNGIVKTLVEIVEIVRERGGCTAYAAGSVFVDGKKMYHLARFGLRVVDGDETPQGAPRALTEHATIALASAPWLRDHAPTHVVPVVPIVEVLDRLATAAVKAMPGRTLVGVDDLAMRGWLLVADTVDVRTIAEPVDADRCRVRLEAWRPKVMGGTFVKIAACDVLFADARPAPPETRAPLDDAPLVHDGSGAPDLYADGLLFHGPAFHVVRTVRWDTRGSSAVVDATPFPDGTTLLNPRLLDGTLQGVPYAAFERWNPEAPTLSAGFPSRIGAFRIFGAPPRCGTARAEIRYEGPIGTDGRFERVTIQGIAADDRVWCTLDLTIVLVDPGRIARVPLPLRRAVMLHGHPHPRMLAHRAEDAPETTHVDLADVTRADFVRGTVATYYELPQDMDRRAAAASVAVKEHLAERLGVAPATILWEPGANVARCALRPYDAYPLAVTERDDRFSVTDHGAAYTDLAPLRAFFDRCGGGADAPMAHLFGALAGATFGSLLFTTRDVRGVLATRPVLFLANHQVMLESPTFAYVLAPFLAEPMLVMARKEIADQWYAHAARLASGYPGSTIPPFELYVDRTDPSDIARGIAAYRAQLATQARSLLVHVQGDYARSTRDDVGIVSASLIDLAIDADLPIVPVRFAGGLPTEPLAYPLQFPIDFARQEYVLGAPILPAALRANNLRERGAMVRDAINALAPSRAEPFPGNPALAAAVARHVARGRPLMAAVLAELFERHDPRTGFDLAPIRAILAGENEPRPEHRAWNAAFREILGT